MKKKGRKVTFSIENQQILYGLMQFLKKKFLCFLCMSEEKIQKE